MITVNQLKSIRECQYKAYISSLNLHTIDTKNLAINKVYREIFHSHNFIELSKEEIRLITNEGLSDNYFLTRQEKDNIIDVIHNQILRYKEYELKLKRELIHQDIKDTVNIGNNDIKIKADLVFNNGNSIEIVKIKTGKPELSYKARNSDNLPENNIELFLLKKLGEKLYGNLNLPIISSFYHMKGKGDEDILFNRYINGKDKMIEDSINISNHINEIPVEIIKGKIKKSKEQKDLEKELKKINDVLYYNNSEGNNVITFNYDADLSDKILDLCEMKLSKYSEKCKSNNCEICTYKNLCNYKPKTNINIEKLEEDKSSSNKVRLTENQHKVTLIDEGNYRINAVAGSGKSTTMVMRVIELLKNGYKPWEILMITFTKKGCQELKSKIKHLCGVYNIKINTNQLHIYTFNSFGEHIISKEWDKLGFDKKPQLATNIDVNEIIKNILTNNDSVSWLNYKIPLLNFPNAKGAFIQLRNYFDKIKAYGYDENTLIENVLSKEKNIESLDLQEKSKTIFKLYNEFNEELKNKNLLQYQDQILYLNQLLSENIELIDKYGYKHMIVDEYQDTDFTQVSLLHILESYKNFESLMVVGDSSQAIYGFRNTTPKNIIDFDKEFNNVEDIYLLDNFRSTPQICNLANKLDKLNDNRIDKDIIGRKENGIEPQLISFDKLSDENKWVIDMIKEKIDNKVPLNEICYIGRTKKELLDIQKILNENNIPNILDVSELFLDDNDVKVILDLANYFKNMDCDYYLMQYINAIIGSQENIKEEVKELSDRIFSDIKEIDSIENYEEKETNKITYFKDLVQQLANFNDVLRMFMDDLFSKEFYTFNQLLDYLHKMALYEDNTAIERDDSKYNAIVLTTAHSSKGKEWSVLINSINKYKYKDADDLEEERRLLFVSITRAKDELYITYNTNQDKTRGKGEYCGFADEIENILKI